MEMVTCPKCAGNSRRNPKMWTGTNGGNGGRCYACNDRGVVAKKPPTNIGVVTVEVGACEMCGILTGEYYAKITNPGRLGYRSAPTEKEAIAKIVSYLQANETTGTIKIVRK